ncbi:hypothetical protein IscW_ISCW001600, partial [Ixodes scapularis]
CSASFFDWRLLIPRRKILGVRPRPVFHPGKRFLETIIRTAAQSRLDRGPDGLRTVQVPPRRPDKAVFGPRGFRQNREPSVLLWHLWFGRAFRRRVRRRVFYGQLIDERKEVLDIVFWNRGRGPRRRR